MLRISL